MIKRLMFVLWFACVGGVIFAQAPASADVVLEQAFKKAKAEKKNVLLIFHASWCGWCKKMDASINDAACKPFFDTNYVIEHLTIQESKDKKQLENPGAEDLFNKYAKGNSGIPFWIIYDADGKVLVTAVMPDGNNTGCPASVDEVNYWIEALKKSSQLDEKTSKSIFDRFRKNEPVRKSN